MARFEYTPDYHGDTKTRVRAEVHHLERLANGGGAAASGIVSAKGGPR
jgi:hypothetical protein